MALGDPYITNSALASYLGIDDTDDNTALTAVSTAASEWVNKYCQRQFNNTTTSSDRTYKPRDWYTVEVDDFHTTTGLVIATDGTGDGSYGTTWAASDYVLEPFDGIEAGTTGFPYRKIVAAESRMFPNCVRRPNTVRVTAQWGWAAVPASVILATKIVAAFLFNLKDSPLGVASFADAGLIRVRDVPQAAMLLQHYEHPAQTGPLVA